MNDTKTLPNPPPGYCAAVTAPGSMDNRDIINFLDGTIIRNVPATTAAQLGEQFRTYSLRPTKPRTCVWGTAMELTTLQMAQIRPEHGWEARLGAVLTLPTPRRDGTFKPDMRAVNVLKFLIDKCRPQRVGGKFCHGRHGAGWQATHSQLSEDSGVGVCNKKVISILKQLEDRGFIIVRRVEHETGPRGSHWSNVRYYRCDPTGLFPVLAPGRYAARMKRSGGRFTPFVFLNRETVTNLTKISGVTKSDKLFGGRGINSMDDELVYSDEVARFWSRDNGKNFGTYPLVPLPGKDTLTSIQRKSNPFPLEAGDDNFSSEVARSCPVTTDSCDTVPGATVSPALSPYTQTPDLDPLVVHEEERPRDERYHLSETPRTTDRELDALTVQFKRKQTLNGYYERHVPGERDVTSRHVSYSLDAIPDARHKDFRIAGNRLYRTGTEPAPRNKQWDPNKHIHFWRYDPTMERRPRLVRAARYALEHTKDFRTLQWAFGFKPQVFEPSFVERFAYYHSKGALSGAMMHQLRAVLTDDNVNITLDWPGAAVEFCRGRRSPKRNGSLSAIAYLQRQIAESDTLESMYNMPDSSLEVPRRGVGYYTPEDKTNVLTRQGYLTPWDFDLTPVEMHGKFERSKMAHIVARASVAGRRSEILTRCRYRAIIRREEIGAVADPEAEMLLARSDSQDNRLGLMHALADAIEQHGVRNFSGDIKLSTDLLGCEQLWENDHFNPVTQECTPGVDESSDRDALKRYLEALSEVPQDEGNYKWASQGRAHREWKLVESIRSLFHMLGRHCPDIRPSLQVERWKKCIMQVDSIVDEVFAADPKYRFAV